MIQLTLADRKYKLFQRLANMTDDPAEKYRLRMMAFNCLSEREKRIYERIGWKPTKDGYERKIIRY